MSESRRRIPIDQGKVIDSLNRFIKNTSLKSTGLILNPEGICAGLTALYLKAKAKGEEKKFFLDLEKIVNLKEEEYEKNAEWVAHFCQQAELAFAPQAYTREIHQGDLDKIFPNEKDKIESTYQFYIKIHLSKQNLNDLFTSIIHKEEMIYLGGSGHTIAIFQRGEQYFLYDPNSEDGEKVFSTIEELYKECLKYLFVKNKDQTLELKVKKFRLNSKSNITRQPDPKKADLIKYISPLDTNYNTSLYDSSIINDEEMFAELLKLGTDPFVEIQPNVSAFKMACRMGHKNILDLSLKNCKQLPAKEKFKEAFRLALLGGHFETIQYLWDYAKLNYPNFLNIADIYVASKSGNPKVIEWFLSLDQNNEIAKKINACDVIEEAFSSDKSDCVSLLINYYKNNNVPIKLSVLIEHAISQGAYNCYNYLANIEKNHAPTSIQLMNAIKHSQLRIAEHLIKNKNLKVSWKHIQKAITCNDVSMLTLLLKGPIEEYLKENLINLLKKSLSGDEESCKALFQSTNNDLDLQRNLLLIAILSHNKAMVTHSKVTLAKNDENATRLLIQACQDGDKEIAQALISSGIDPNQLIDIKMSDDSFKKLPLITHTLVENPEMALWLLQNAAPPPQDDLHHLMMIACRYGDAEIVKELLKKGVSCDLEVQGNTSKIQLIEYACNHNQFGIVEILLEHGANLTKIANGGEAIIKKSFDNYQFSLAKKIKDQNPALTQIFNDNLSVALEKACKSGDADSANFLLECGAQFQNNNYSELLYSAYKQLESMDVQKRTDIQLIQYAHFYKHTAIIKFLLSKNNYLLELTKPIDPKHELNTTIKLFNSTLKNNLKKIIRKPFYFTTMQM